MDTRYSIVGDRNTLIVNDPKTIDALLRIIERQQSEIARLTKLVFELQTKQGKKAGKTAEFWQS